MVRILRFTSAAALVALISAALAPAAALAHTEVESGSYIFEIGWAIEPVVVGYPNSLYLFITEKDSAEGEESGGEQAGEEVHAAAGVTDAAATLTFTVEYGGVRQSYPIRPVVDQPGVYAADFIPTREGQYTFVFGGTINGEAVNLTFEPEEVETAGQLAFPEPMPSSAELIAKLDAAQAQAGTALTVGIIGIVVGLVGTGLAVFTVLRKK